MDNKEIKTGNGPTKRDLSIYTPLSLAKKEIWKRWNNKALKKKVEDFLEGDVPEFLKGEPRAFLARQVATPNFEFLRFLKLAEKTNLKPACLEYLDDKFASENQYKYHLGKICIYCGVGKKMGEKIIVNRIIDFNESERKVIKEIKTVSGKSLVDFHHGLFTANGYNKEVAFIDASDWVERNGKTPNRFYSKLFAVLTCFGILFENYSDNKDEGDFTKNIVLPNFKQVENILGVRPLIVKIMPMKDQDKDYYFYYSEKISLIE
jgi:hypothetical protein